MVCLYVYDCVITWEGMCMCTLYMDTGLVCVCVCVRKVCVYTATHVSVFRFYVYISIASVFAFRSTHFLIPSHPFTLIPSTRFEKSTTNFIVNNFGYGELKQIFKSLLSDIKMLSIVFTNFYKLTDLPSL